MSNPGGDVVKVFPLRLLMVIVLMLGVRSSLWAGTSASWESSLQIMQDMDCQLGIEAVLRDQTGACRWQQANSSMLNFGFSSAVYWIKFDAESVSADDNERILEIANPKISQLDIYLLAHGLSGVSIERQWSSGVSVPVQERAFYHRNFVFPMLLSASEKQSVLIRVQSQYPLKLPLFWTPTQGFHERNLMQTLFQGAYFGSILIMAFYNLFIYLVVRDRSYANYFVFMIVMATFFAVDRGLAYQFFWPGQIHTDYVAYVALMSFAAAWSVLFSVEFLSLEQHLPVFARGFKYLSRFWLLMTVIAFQFASPTLVVLEVLVVVPAGVALLTAGFLAWRKGVPAAPYYLIAWVVIIQGAVIYALTLVDLFPSGWYADYALQISSIAEAALLSLGLAHRIKTLDQERSLAYASARAKTEFIATISHEIRTPMNGMLGMAQLLRETGVSEQQQRYVNTILSSGQALLTLLNDTLDFSKIEAKKLELECISFDVRQLVDESAAIFALRAEEKALRFFVNVDIRVPQFVMGDPTRIRQVLTNLLNNAFKFTEQGGITLVVSVDSGNNQLVFSVQDSGIGMTAETVARLFSPYMQATAGTARKFGGTGLGLSICKHLAEMMGGSIGATSQPEAGSQFRFALPLPEDVDANAAVREMYSIPPRFSALQVVSADAALMKMMAAYARHLGLSFGAFYNISALAEANPVKESLVLLDTHETSNSLQALAKFENSRSGWLQCQWALIVKPGQLVQKKRLADASVELAPDCWIFETPFSVSSFMKQVLVPQAVEETQQNTTALLPASHMYRGKRVLVVDDNPINSMVVCGFLNKLELESRVAHSANEALDLLEHGQPFDLVFMDCEMPGMNGYEATAEIRKREREKAGRRLPIVALSAHIHTEHRQRCLSAGMDDVLTKPVVFAELQARLAALLTL